MDFLKAYRRFDLRYDGKTMDELAVCVSQSVHGSSVTTEYRFHDGFKLTNVARKIDAFGAYEWVNWLENTADTPTKIISDLWDCSVVLPLEHEEYRQNIAYFPDPEKATKVYAPTGCSWDKLEFYVDIDHIHDNVRTNHIEPGQTKEYACVGGRSSDTQAPFFNVHKNGAGYVFAIGWTGQWNCSVSRTCDDVVIRTKIEDTHFRLLPGEKIRTSSIVLMPYSGSFTQSQNQWRRLVKNEFSLIGAPGRDPYGPLCAGIWGGMTTPAVIQRVEKIRELDLPFEYIWMDAGWYGIDTAPTANEFEGDWYDHTGDWRVSPLIHENGLKDVAKAVHDSGRKFLLWFEPERVIKGTPITKDHPEYFIGIDGSKDMLLDLGREDAWNYCYETVCEKIESIGIDCYRQDFNFRPLPYWRKNDAPDRQGITEIKHITGMYRFWDALLERFPHLLIDNCASGGRRIDIEAQRRSIPLWRSDLECPANYDIEGAQTQHLGINSWLPHSGTGSGRQYDEYRIRSAYDSSMTTNYFFAENEPYADTPEKVAFLRKYCAEYRKARPYFSGDFYPLTDITTNLDAWSAAQFHRPEQNDGIIQVFRRGNSPYETALFQLGGLSPACSYVITDADTGVSTTHSGAELLEKGLSLTVKERRKAKLYFYTAI